MLEEIKGKELAAAVLVGTGLATFAELGVEISPVQTHLVENGRRIALGLRFRPEEKAATIAHCRAILGIT